MAGCREPRSTFEVESGQQGRPVAQDRAEQSAREWRAFQEAIGMAEAALKAKQHAYETLQQQTAKDRVELEARKDALSKHKKLVKRDESFLKGEVTRLMRDRRQMRDRIAQLERDSNFLLEERNILLQQLEEADEGSSSRADSHPLEAHHPQDASPSSSHSLWPALSAGSQEAWGALGTPVPPSWQPQGAESLSLASSPPPDTLQGWDAAAQSVSPTEPNSQASVPEPEQLRAEQARSAALAGQLQQAQRRLLLSEQHHTQQQALWQERERSLIFSLEAVLRGSPLDAAGSTSVQGISQGLQEAASAAGEAGLPTGPYIRSKG